MNKSIPARNVSKRGFTLVELLVVIGIIAVLIAILLPTLANARRHANAVKCATQLREIFAAFNMYAIDNKGYYPPSQLQTATPVFKYNVDGVDYPPPGGNYGAYWFTFLAKYVTKSRMGEAAGSDAGAAAQSRKTIFWGCPNWDGYVRASAPGGLHPTQIGFGMTWWPDTTPTDPATTDYPNGSPTGGRVRSNFIQGWRPNLYTFQGKFWKQHVYGRFGAQRALVADSRFWALNSRPNTGTMPFQPTPVSSLTQDYNGPGQTYADLFRHGKTPPTLPGNRYSNRGGRVSYNILYCDGHVVTTSDWRDAFRSVRLKFPG